MTKSTIEWTNDTWNPLLGCSKVSAGCSRCYAVGHVQRMAGNPNATIHAANAGLTARHRNGQLDWTGTIRLLPERLDQPLHWAKPRRVFANSLSDLFHPDVPDDFIAHVWAVMALTPQHTYQILTKRPERIEPILSTPRFYSQVLIAAQGLRTRFPRKGLGDIPISNPATHLLENVWIGTSCEDQAAADARVPHLLATPAAVRFLSCEPLLGPIDLEPWLWTVAYHDDGQGDVAPEQEPSGAISWCIVGGESGPGARPLQADWLNGLVERCIEADVPLFVKQTGSAWAREHGYTDRKGGSPEEWPTGWRIRQWPKN